MPARRTLGLVTAALAVALGLAGLTPAAATAAPAPSTAAMTVTLAGHSYVVEPHDRAGVKPIAASAAPAAGNTLSVRSDAKRGVVSPKPKVYLVFWGSQWSSDPAGAAPALRNFFSGLFGQTDTWGTILTQYCEGVPKGTTTCGNAGTHVQHPTSSLLAGSWSDNAAAAPVQATAAQIAGEAVRAAEHFGNTTQAPNNNAQYVVVSAHGTHPDGFPNSGFCGWHDYTHSTVGNVAYTNLPYVPDLGAGGCTTINSPKPLDGLFSTETHEYAETVTDFFPSRGWNGGGGEIGDECVQLDSRLALSTGTFDVQGLWSNQQNRCTTTGP
jgi:hypothetical protein